MPLSLLFLGIGRSLFIGDHPDLELHRHSTLQISFALDHLFDVRSTRLPWTSAAGVVIAPSIPHQIKALRGTGVSLQVVPEARYTDHLTQRVLGGAGIYLLHAKTLTPFVRFFRNALEGTLACSEVFLACERLIETLTGVDGKREIVDERLLVALDKIESELPGQISLKSLAHHVCLSEDRFLHLFSEQLGLPLRPYILHQRMMRATAEVLDGRSITQAAVNTGFSDTAHFSRTFLKLTGLHPSIIKSYRGSVKVSTCASSRCIRPTALDPTGERCLSCVLNRPRTAS